MKWKTANYTITLGCKSDTVLLFTGGKPSPIQTDGSPVSGGGSSPSMGVVIGVAVVIVLLVVIIIVVIAILILWMRYVQ